ncbi:MAG: Asp-tRNA(Asn)/Glu-tRNA(Gln) amidotransferase subunit GatB [bacterium]
MDKLKTTIGLEIHVQLKTKSKMFCKCDNNAEGRAPNTVVCPVCLGLPGALPVANELAILSTIKTGIALDCTIPKIAKFDRKHYFYPDLPKGYQISQFDEPFCVGGFLKIDGHKVRLNRIHLEEDAGKLIHSNGKSLVDLNRAGTPLMEIVTEPDIQSPKQAADFLRKLQKIVRDVVSVSEASMEKGHMRCDANISITDGEKMSEIVELKNINSFRFVEKALIIEEKRLREKYPNWPEKNEKETRGYNSDTNTTYTQRRKEAAADYRYFPEPDLPPFNTSKYDLDKLESEISEDMETLLVRLTAIGIPYAEGQILLNNEEKMYAYNAIVDFVTETQKATLAKSIVHNYFDFDLDATELDKHAIDYGGAIGLLATHNVSKNMFQQIVSQIHVENISYQEAFLRFANQDLEPLESVIDKILAESEREVAEYRSGKNQLFGFFVGQVMKVTKGQADPREISKILKQKLEV